MDYSSIAAWMAACPANLVTADQRWIGECYDQGKLTAAASVGTAITTDATRYIILRCASGASFNAKAGVRSTALTYNSTTGSGVALEFASFDNLQIFAPYTVVDGLQVQAASGVGVSLGNIANVQVKNCMITKSGSSGYLIQDGNSGMIWANNLLIYQFSSGIAANIVGHLYNCSLVNAGSAGSSTGIQVGYNVGTAKNTAIFGFSAATNGASTLGSASDYNATDNSSIAQGGGGTHNVTSLTYASQFTSVTNDFRATFGGGLHAGTPDATNSPTDITATTRDATTPYIGAWEATSVAPGVAAPISPIRSQALNRSINY